MCQLTNFGASNEETESKIEIYAKKLSKLGDFGNFNFWSKVNEKVKLKRVKVNGQPKVNSLGKSMVYTVRVGSRCLGRVTDRAVESLMSSDDVALTRIRACIANDMACLRVADVDRRTSS